MANWTLTGDLGAGKSIIAAGKIRDHLSAGLPVATNMDIYLHNMLPPYSKASYIRLPDFPTADELWAIGKASDKKTEETFGLLALDELAVFLNSREWQGKGRDMVIKYLRHVRKRHWHTLFITQDIESIDAQARRALIEHKVTCKRTDRLTIPIIGVLLRALGFMGTLPRMHMGYVRYGKSEYAPLVATWTYYGKSLHNAYDTDQVFTDDEKTLEWLPYDKAEQTEPPIVATVAGMYTVLSNYHTQGRYMTFFMRHKPLVKKLTLSALGIASLYLLYHFYFTLPPVVKQPDSVAVEQPEPKAFPLKGILESGGAYILTTQQGHILESRSRLQVNNKMLYQVGEKWYAMPE